MTDQGRNRTRRFSPKSPLLLGNGVSFGLRAGVGLRPGWERVGPLDEPPESEEGAASEDGGAPGLGVPAAVLAHREPPLVPKRGGIRDRRVRRVRVPAAGACAAAAGPAGSGDAALRRRRRRLRRDGLLLARHFRPDLLVSMGLRMV
jgi:hypothetical protein